jgi:hypothetical protein
MEFLMGIFRDSVQQFGNITIKKTVVVTVVLNKNKWALNVTVCGGPVTFYFNGEQP